VLTESPRVTSEHRPDYGGALLITAALAFLAFGLSQSEVWGWIDPRTLLTLAAGLTAIPIFVRRQRTHAEPILDLALFDSRSFTVANISALTFMAAFAAYSLNNVLFLRQAWGYSVLTAGLLTALPPVTVALLAPFSGRFASRIGFRPFVIAGPLIVTASTLCFWQFIGAERDPLLFVLIGELTAIGIACFIPVNSAAAVAELPPQRLSVGGAVNNTFRQGGSVLGIALLVSVLGSPETPAQLVDAHHRGWLMISALTLVTAIIGLAQPALRRTPSPTSAAAPAAAPAT
jgi:MFS family permease